MNEDFALVESLERRLLDPESRELGQAFNELLDDAFFEIGRSGRVFDKEAILKSETNSGKPIVEIDSVRCRYLSDNTILMNYRSWRVNCADSAKSLRTSIWQRSNQSWRLVFHQGTPTELKEE